MKGIKERREKEDPASRSIGRGVKVYSLETKRGGLSLSLTENEGRLCVDWDGLWGLSGRVVEENHEELVETGEKKDVYGDSIGLMDIRYRWGEADLFELAEKEEFWEEFSELYGKDAACRLKEIIKEQRGSG